MIYKKYSSYKTAAFTALLIINLLSSAQAMEYDYDAETAHKPVSLKEKMRLASAAYDKAMEKLAVKEKKRPASAAYDKAMEKLVVKEYAEAFRLFVYVAFEDFYHVDDFKSSENKEYGGALVKGFYTLSPLSESLLRQYASFGYVYILWESNGEGLDHNCAMGKAMKECIGSYHNEALINPKCSPETQRILLEDSKGWRLENISKIVSDPDAIFSDY